MRRPQLPDAAAALAAAGRAARPAAGVSANTAASIDSATPIAGTGTTSATAAEPCPTAAVTSHTAPVHLRGGRRVRRSRGALLLGALMP